MFIIVMVCYWFQHYCTLPKYHCSPTSMKIHPTTENLVIAYANRNVSYTDDIGHQNNNNIKFHFIFFRL